MKQNKAKVVQELPLAFHSSSNKQSDPNGETPATSTENQRQVVTRELVHTKQQ